MAPPPGTGPVLTRRQLILAGAGALLAAACGDSGRTAADRGATTSSSAVKVEDTTLLRFFSSQVPVGKDLRLPFGLADQDGVPLTRTPEEIAFAIAPENGKPGQPHAVARHNQGLPRPYYPVMASFDAPGVYTVLADLGGATVRSSVMAVPQDQAPQVPGPGDPMIPVATPTVDDPLGVDPICTREPPCPLHDVSLDKALQAGKPVAFLIASPAFCQVQICGPVLEVLLGQRQDFGDRVTMIHNEVYTSTDLEQTTDAVEAYHLPSEPILFLAGADGVIRTRLDNIYDTVELRAALEKLVA